MKNLSLFFFFTFLFAAIAFWYLQDPGHIGITWLGYEIQLSVAVGIATLLLSLFLLSLVGKMILWLLGIPFRFFTFLQDHQKKEAWNQLLEQLTSLEAENFSEALQHQKKIGTGLENDPFFLWISANTLEKTGKSYEAETLFSKLTDASFLGLKGRIRLALERGDQASARTLLEQADKLQPCSPWVLKHLLALTYEDRNFGKAKELIKKEEDLKILPPAQAKKQLAHLCYLEASQSDLSLEKKEALLKEAHSLDPRLSEAAESLAQILVQKGQGRDALRVLEATWCVNPAQPLGDLYLTLSAPKSGIDAYQAATRLVKKASHLPESLLFLAQTALNARLWGESRAQLTLLHMQHPTAEVYGLLATLELEENQNLKAAIGWLEKGIKAPRRNCPDLP